MQMNVNTVFKTAYSRLIELYGGEYSPPDPRILGRFYREKMILRECKQYLRDLELALKLKERAKERGDHIYIGSTGGSSFVSYLLGLTDINPLPSHEYCPSCHSVRFRGEKTPFDIKPIGCLCGKDTVTDGFDIPFESNLKSVLSGHMQICVPQEFLNEAERIIRDEMSDMGIIALRNGGDRLVRLCFTENEINDGVEYTLNDNRDVFSDLPRVTLVSYKTFDKLCKLEKATGLKMSDVGPKEYSQVFFALMDGNLEGIPHLDNPFMKELWKRVDPQSFGDILKLIGFAHSTNIWRDNAELIYDDHRMSLNEIPAFREELYGMICDRLYKYGIYDTGLAYEVTDKAMRGCYARAGALDPDTALSLLDLGFDTDFLFFLERVNYMFPKAHGAIYLREAVIMMVYKLNFSKEYNEIMSEESENE